METWLIETGPAQRWRPKAAFGAPERRRCRPNANAPERRLEVVLDGQDPIPSQYLPADTVESLQEVNTTDFDDNETPFDEYHVTVMADYSCFPLWFDGGGCMIGRDHLPLPPALIEALSDWNREYDETLSSNEYQWPTEAQMYDWNARGRVLAGRVAASLGPIYKLFFFDEPTGEREPVSLGPP